ncbi:MAG: hypothetical protein ACK5MY_02505 [Jhaorihella sp.]
MAETNLCDQERTVRFDEFIPYVAVQADGVPASVIGHAVRLSAIEFAQRTKVIRRTMYVDLQQCVQYYPLLHDDCYQIMLIDQVCKGFTTLKPTTIECCMAGGCWYAYERPNALYIGLIPDCDLKRGLELRVVTTPGQDSCFIDEWVYQQHAETIAQGALYRILKMADEEWFQPSMASVAAREFNNGVTRAVSADRGRNALHTQKVPMPRGFFV